MLAKQESRRGGHPERPSSRCVCFAADTPEDVLALLDRQGHADRSRPTLRLVELRNDDGHLVGWIPLGEAVAAALANIAGGAHG
jgi:hypothetical protein